MKTAVAYNIETEEERIETICHANDESGVWEEGGRREQLKGGRSFSCVEKQA